MKKFSLPTTILQFDTCREICEYFKIGEGDLLFFSEKSHEGFFCEYAVGAKFLFRTDYGVGEPTDIMVEQIWEDVNMEDIQRVFAIGGGTVIDVAKLLSLKQVAPIEDLFYSKKIEPQKARELIVVPTTCGTGSEVTNVSILELKRLETKLGLADDTLYPDYAALIPELIDGLPYAVFATSSIDALIHATESYLSPKATKFSKSFSEEAIRMIVSGYKEVEERGKDCWKERKKEFLIASNYGGIAFGNAGTGAVHAMSYPLGAKYHIPHGESNYVIFVEVLKMYLEKKPKGDIQKLNCLFAEVLECPVESVYETLEKLLEKILPKKAIHEYGVKEEELIAFTDNVMTKQGRLMVNNYTTLEERDILKIYQNLY